MNNLNAPIYVTSVTDGKLMLGGLFKMQDQVGFPIDASFEECKSRGCLIDWLEALCDCWVSDCMKFDSFVRQSTNLSGIDLSDKFKDAGAVVLALFPKMKNTPNPIDTVCRYILQKKKLHLWKFNL